MLGKGLIPGLNDVPEQARRGVHGRDAGQLGVLFGGAPREDGRGGIDPAVAEPALRRGDEAAGHLPAATPRELTHDPRRVAPGISGDLARDRGVEERREQRAGGDLGGGDELGDREDARRRRPIEGAQATTVCVVPRSIPTARRRRSEDSP